MSTPAKTRDWTSPRHDQEIVHYRVADGIAVIEMDDPPANTYTYAMNRQLDEAILKARFDDDVHVLVLRGKGDRFFSAGANIGMLNAVTPGFKYLIRTPDEKDSSRSARIVTGVGRRFRL